MKTLALIAAALISTAAAPALASDPSSVTLTLDTGAPTGRVMVVLFDSEAAYAQGGKPIAQAIVDVAAGQHQAVFADLPAGDYAARMFHDVDGDGKMNTNPFGMPTEPYAFSNNARGNMGPAGWDRARFAVSGAVVQTISLR